MYISAIPCALRKANKQRLGFGGGDVEMHPVDGGTDLATPTQTNQSINPLNARIRTRGVLDVKTSSSSGLGAVSGSTGPVATMNDSLAAVRPSVVISRGIDPVLPAAAAPS